MQENGVATDTVIPEVLTRMRQFTQMNKLKKNALKVRLLCTLRHTGCLHLHVKPTFAFSLEGAHRNALDKKGRRWLQALVQQECGVQAAHNNLPPFFLSDTYPTIGLSHFLEIEETMLVGLRAPLRS